MKKYIKEFPNMPEPWGYRIEYDKLFEYINLPDPPREFILSLDEIKQLPQNSWFQRPPDISSEYDSCPCQEKLQKWIKNVIPNSYYNGNDSKVRYHWMTDKLHIHSDWTRIECWNYTIEPGGPNAYTSFYDSNNNLLEKHIIEPRRWHWLNVGTKHTVSNFSGIRYGISISGKCGTRNYNTYNN